MNDDDEEHLGSPTKRRRISRSGVDSSTHVFKQPANGDFNDYDACSPMAQDIGTKTQGDPDAIMSLSAATRLAGQTVAPFLAKHIPEQYAPLGGIDKPKDSPVNPNLSTKYCYRHRPDLKCRRQADELSMDQLQHVSISEPPWRWNRQLTRSGTRSAVACGSAGHCTCLVCFLRRTC